LIFPAGRNSAYFVLSLLLIGLAKTGRLLSDVTLYIFMMLIVMKNYAFVRQGAGGELTPLFVYKNWEERTSGFSPSK